MKILVAPDSFKGNMTAAEVCEALAAGLRDASPETAIQLFPLADGGEGTARALTLSAGGRFVKALVSGPLGERITAEFGLIENGRVAVLDMASASGLELMPPEKLNPMIASSFGTGELMKAAMDAGAEELIIGIGGSATVDGGIGMAQALGFAILDKNDQPVGQGGQALNKVDRIVSSGADTRLAALKVRVACDVTNPLTGEFGAARVFGPQKGATREQILSLDAGLHRLGEACRRSGFKFDKEQSGDGAAGGMGAALRVFLGASIESGARLVMRRAGFYQALKTADLVITGEGMTDSQTAGGKLCSIVAADCRAAGVPVALLSGALGGDAPALLTHFDYAAAIACGQIGLAAMIRDSRRDLRLAAANLLKAILLGCQMGNASHSNNNQTTSNNQSDNSNSP